MAEACGTAVASAALTNAGPTAGVFYVLVSCYGMPACETPYTLSGGEGAGRLLPDFGLRGHDSQSERVPGPGRHDGRPGRAGRVECWVIPTAMGP